MTTSTRADGMSGDPRGGAAVERARRGDRAAFATLVDRHLEDAYRIASVLVGASAAETAIEDAFVAAWHELPRLADPAEFGSWLESIVVGVCAMHARRVSPAGGTPPSIDGAPRPGLGLGDGLAREQALWLLEDAFEGLEPNDRAAIVLHELGGRSVAEIARIVHEPAGSVRVRLAESKAALLRALEADR